MKTFISLTVAGRNFRVAAGEMHPQVEEREGLDVVENKGADDTGARGEEVQ